MPEYRDDGVTFSAEEIEAREESRAAMEHAQRLDEAARELALNDCQQWDNLPKAAQNYYRAEARL